jgi:Family of unknown function (DUF6114)
MTTLTSEQSPDHARDSGLSRARYSFRHWRWGRPFWGALFVGIGGAEIMYIPYSPIGVVLHEGIAGVGGMFIGALMIMFAISAVFAPSYRVFAGIASILLALVALPATNFGGFLFGSLCALFGGAFVVAWAPRAGMTADTRTQLRKARKQAETAQAAEVGAHLYAADEPGADETRTMQFTPDAPDGFSESEIVAAEHAAAAARLAADPEPEPERVPEPEPAADHSPTTTDPED